MVTTHIINDPDSLIGTFFHLANYPQSAQALDTLKRIASLVKPIMRKHHFRIAKLAEFYPEMEPNLLGLNTSFPGSSNLPIIQLRLRQPYDSRVFMPYESVVKTMLHELTHCVHGPHDDKFWAMFRSLEGELDTLRYTGYTGEGFLGKGESLGASPQAWLSDHEAKKRARAAAAEKRRRRNNQGGSWILGTGSLGPIRWTIEDVPGSPSTLKPRDGAERNGSGSGGGGGRVSAPPMMSGLSPYADPRQTAAEAALKRQREKDKVKGKGKVSVPIKEPAPTRRGTEGVCSGVRHSTAEIFEREIAQMHGFESVAAMENANEQAIMAAAIELLEEADREEERLKVKDREQQWQQPAGSAGNPIDFTGQPIPKNINRTQSAPANPEHSGFTVPIMGTGWSCPICTFLNEQSHLQCSVCRVERNTKLQDDSETRAQLVAYKDFERKQVQRTNSGEFGKGKGIDRSTYQPAPIPVERGGGGGGRDTPTKIHKDITINGQPTWQCRSCGWFVGQEWWSCGNCGNVKAES
ncbi:hypothetical protein H072_7359 [Dactylellina haptotyla CBS 200.50]|uniref:WLM domain-containing protein n=1 Tax=Dactylellina haptotyla (strain CBS 200.50) TaxID=1284197 RepID=S8A7B0_DACHA|nr:hypothetical protein H072_7359 [Dactylellina haptotyla CBS 200.50]